MLLIFYFLLPKYEGDWVAWAVRTKVMTSEEIKATMAMLTEASMDR